MMDHSDQGSEDNTQKRKRRPKSYQGCTQCRLARRKCGEGKIGSRILFLSRKFRAFASGASRLAEKPILCVFESIANILM